MSRDWNKAYAEEDTPWDKGYAAPPLMEFLERQRVNGRVLVPGCGTGHDVRALSAQGAEVLGLDIAPGALAKANAFPRAGQEFYELGDFLNLAAGHHSAYDWVFEHTCLCALAPGDRQAYIDAVKKALKPGGYYLAIFFREVDDYTGEEPPHPISSTESKALLSDDFALKESFVPQQTYPGRPIGAEEVSWYQINK
ncbi:MAG: TPMT family class I SAM-dependent methyltransferase [Opitutales bacterium]|nr:TPMT family class I SAM-dependent methyltransferase [Opitutales bacterium]